MFKWKWLYYYYIILNLYKNEQIEKMITRCFCFCLIWICRLLHSRAGHWNSVCFGDFFQSVFDFDFDVITSIATHNSSEFNMLRNVSFNPDFCNVQFLYCISKVEFKFYPIYRSNLVIEVCETLKGNWNFSLKCSRACLRNMAENIWYLN